MKYKKKELLENIKIKLLKSNLSLVFRYTSISKYSWLWMLKIEEEVVNKIPTGTKFYII